MDIVSIIIWMVLGLLSLVLVGGVIFFIVMERKYRHRAIIKDPNNRINRVFFDRFRIVKDRDGMTTWKFRKLKKEVSPAPSDAVEVDHKGRMVVTWYRYDEENFIPGKDGYEDQDSQELLKSVKPLLSDQRAVAISQWNKSQRDRKKSWQEMLEKAVPYIVIIMLVTIMLIFVPDVIKARGEVEAEANAQVNEMLEHLTVITANLDRIVNDRGVLVSETTPQGNSTVMEAPN